MSFFFFKHKTAYERRISDWSSDVCSSDLVELGIAAPIGKLAALVLVVERGVHPSPHQLGEDVEKGLADRSGEGEIRFEIAIQMIVEDAAHATMHLAVGDVEIIVRSEEHTSELQSLMRISYAVFCLKKKTKKIK